MGQAFITRRGGSKNSFVYTEKYSDYDNGAFNVPLDVNRNYIAVVLYLAGITTSDKSYKQMVYSITKGELTEIFNVTNMASAAKASIDENGNFKASGTSVVIVSV